MNVSNYYWNKRISSRRVIKFNQAKDSIKKLAEQNFNEFYKIIIFVLIKYESHQNSGNIICISLHWNFLKIIF